MRRWTVLSAVLGCLSIGVPLAAAEPLDDAADWLREHYFEIPIGAGWRVTGIDRGQRDIFVNVTVPRDDAATLKQMPPDRQLQVVGIVCPSAYSDVWAIMPSRSDIVVRDAVGGKIFDDVACRR